MDDRTNSLVVACPTPMYEDIKKLVAQLEKAASDSTQQVQVIPVTFGVLTTDTLEQAIERALESA